MSHRLTGTVGALVLVVVAACGGASGSTSTRTRAGDIHKIKHVVVIMQENRSYDTYFGTYPKADGILLQDHMFEPNASWSLPEHLFQVSEWSANCPDHDPARCQNALQAPGLPPDFRAGQMNGQRQPPIYAWTDLTYLLHQNQVSWGYYVVA